MEDLLGKSFSSIFSSADPKWLELYGDTAFQGNYHEATKYSCEISKHLMVQCYQIAYGYCGCLITDVTKQSRQQELTRISLETERTVVSCAQKLISSPNFEESLSLVLKSILNYFLGSRAYIFEFDWDKQIGVSSYEQCAAGVSPEMQNLQAVPLDAMHAWMKNFQAGRHVHIPDVETLKDLPERREEYDTLTAQGVRRLLAVPYSFSGKLQGFIGVDDPEIHVNDIGFLTNLTYFISVEMEKRRLNQCLQAEEEKFRIATENSDIAFWTYDYARHAIVQTNSSHTQHGFDMVVENVPESLIACGHIRKDSQKAFAEMYRQLEKGAKAASGDFWTLNPRTNAWWCERISYTNVFDAHGKPVRAYAVGRDVTEEIQQRIDRTKLDVALSGSNLYIWEYDMVTKRAIEQSNGAMTRDMPPILENFPDCVIQMGKVHSGSIEAYRELHRQVSLGAAKAQKDICLLLTDDTPIWKRCTYTTIFADGRPVSAIGCAVDISNVKDMERKFQEESAYIEAAQSDKLIVKVRSNITQNIVESYIAKDAVGISADGTPYEIGVEQLAATGFTEKEQDMIRHYLNRQRVLKAFSEGETSYSIDYRRKAHDGSVLWVNTTVKTYQNPENGDVMSFMYSYDINEEKIKEGLLETVTSLEYDFIVYIDLIGNRIKTYLGREDRTMLPAATSDDYVAEMKRVNRAIIAPEEVDRAISDMMPETIKKNLQNQRVFSSVYTAVDSDGNLLKKRFQYAYLNEEMEQVVMTRTDVTDVVEAQKQQQNMLEAALLAAQQANSAKSDFLSRMSHEIRTPMNAIIGMSTIAAQSIGNDEEVADCIGKIGISSRFLLSLINDILDMSRIESGKMLLKNEKIPFAEFLNGVNTICYTQAKAKDVDYENIVDSNVEDYYIGDAMKLQQVVINILSNAIKFTPHNGKVTFSVRQMKKDKHRAVLRFVINDTGCGISEEFIPHLFEAFSQEHSGTTAMYGGTGLGLAICKNLVDMMDGHIGVRSIVGAGTEFTVDVKLGITEESRTRYLSKTQYNFSQLKALVVDDDVMVCEQAVITLKEIGVTSEWVDSGRKAVDRVQHKWTDKQYYDLILVDWKMPEMDGIETARQIRKIVGPDVTIIIMTAYDWASIEQEAKRAGVNLLMSKPMFKSTLISAFQKVFGQQAEQETVVTADFKFDGKRVLLAEDHPLNVEVATRLLECKGFTVEHAENGLRALEMFTTTPEGYYDAILMDIRMPQMDGLQASNSIRHLTKKDAKTVPIIAMTANAFDEDVQKSKAAGMNAHLAKPIEPQEMYQTLYDFIYGKKD
ncbi:MAG: response regulator [Oscillibacter sp.]|nr:response regulator [Oscillibacter sp.]